MGRISLISLLLCAFASLAFSKTVVIDAGHGGRDVGGKFGKVYEKHLALDTAMRLEYYLKKKGYNTVMVRRSDRFVSLSQRSAIANRHPGAIFVSIHYNYTWKRNVEGLETFYHSGKSKALATAVHKGMHSQVRCADRGVKSARYYVLRNTRIPAILVEGGFLSHSGERSQCKKGSYRDNLVRGIVDGIVRFDKSGQW